MENEIQGDLTLKAADGIIISKSKRLRGKKTMYYAKSQAKWKKEHTKQYSVRLHNEYDADLVDYMENSNFESSGGEIKRLMRLAIAYEKEHGRQDVESNK